MILVEKALSANNLFLRDRLDDARTYSTTTDIFGTD